ncbi:MAG TPA: SpoIIE family protein phosphatase [Caulobacteraceae bacterium]|nr:SpoIIE family protein phosphatase [Caulobacteraceae bacterium]
MEKTLFVPGSAAVAAPAVRVGHFISFEYEGEHRRVRIGPEGLTVGREPSCDIVLAVPAVSRNHCRIALEGHSVVVSDLGSTNGSTVGGRRIERPTRLHNGAHVAVGPYLLTYEQRDERQIDEEARLSGELREAVRYVRAILPEPIATGAVQTEWWYVPSSELGGDAFGYQFLDETTLVGFLIDVTGHGIGSGMHAANVANVLRRRALAGVDFRDPGQIADGLNAMFPMEDYDGMMFTAWVFVYEAVSRLLKFCSAGHHPSYLVAPGKADAAPLWRKAPTVGMLPTRNWTVGEATIEPGSRLYVFSDGCFEVVDAKGAQWEIEDLRRIIQAGPTPDVGEAQRLYQAVRAAARPGPLADDFSALVLHFA